LFSGGQTKTLRQSRVVGQFFISIALIIVTMLVNEQMQFMRNKDLGINKEYSLVVKNYRTPGRSAGYFFEQQLADQAAVTSASYTSHTIPGSHYTTFLKQPGETQDHVMAVFWADYERDNVLEIEMLERRYFDRDH
jgi:putative ABC transport system permease protein